MELDVFHYHGRLPLRCRAKTYWGGEQCCDSCVYLEMGLRLLQLSSLVSTVFYSLSKNMFYLVLCCHGRLKMLMWTFLTKSIFLSREHDLIPASEQLRTVYHSSRSFLKSWRRERKRNVRWSHVRLDSCAAHFGMEQTHLFSRWLPVLKITRGFVCSENTWPAPPSGSHYWVSLPTSLAFILFDKNDKHISLFTMRFTSFVKSRGESLTAWQCTDSGGISAFKTATYEWVRMESCGEGIMC